MPTKVQQTSIDSYHSLSSKEADCQQLLHLYQHHGNLTDRLASDLLGWYPSQVAARRNDLIKQRQIVDKGTVRDSKTNKTVKVWGLMDTLF